MKKMAYSIAMGLSLACMVWIGASWINVLMHNNPVLGDYLYAPWNFFLLIAK